MHTKPGKFDFLFEGEYAIFPEEGAESIIGLTPEMMIIEDSAQKPKLITGTENVEKFIDNIIADLQNGRKAGEFYLGKPVTRHVQTARERRMLHQKLGYTDDDLEDIRKVFNGCDPELVAREVLCVKDMKPEKAMRILPYLGVSKYSKKELKEIHSKIHEEDRNIEDVLFFKSKAYGAELDAYKNDQRTKRVEEAKRRQYLASLPASAAPQGTPSL